jgi:hypothetical protein
MGFFDMFRRGAPIAARGPLMDFLDQQSAFLAQKGVYEYARALAGPYANLVFREASFLVALGKARWQAFPLALAMVGEVVEGQLRPDAGERSRALLQGVIGATLDTLDRYPVPPELSAQEWSEARHALEHDLNMISLHPVKRAMDIPVRFVDRYVAVIPIHEKLRGKDTPTIHNYLKANLCNIHEAFQRRADLPALVAILTGPPAA